VAARPGYAGGASAAPTTFPGGLSSSTARLTPAAPMVLPTEARVSSWSSALPSSRTAASARATARGAGREPPRQLHPLSHPRADSRKRPRKSSCSYGMLDDQRLGRVLFTEYLAAAEVEIAARVRPLWDEVGYRPPVATIRT
jgi:hypothetical protein